MAKKYTFVALVTDVLKQSRKPLTYIEIWNKAEELGLTKQLKTRGKTPTITIASSIYAHIHKYEDSKIVLVSQKPCRFGIRDRKYAEVKKYERPAKAAAFKLK